MSAPNLYLIVYKFQDEEEDWLLLPETEMHDEYARQLAKKHHAENFGYTDADMELEVLVNCWWNKVTHVRRDENSPQYEVILKEVKL